MKLENKTIEALKVMRDECMLLLTEHDEDLTDADAERLEDLRVEYGYELRYRQMKKEHDAGEKPIRAGYYAGRGYYDANPRRKVREFSFKVSRLEAYGEERLWKAAEADLAKRWSTKRHPHPGIEEVWA
jgi:hypothetical protein